MHIKKITMDLCHPNLDPYYSSISDMRSSNIKMGQHQSVSLATIDLEDAPLYYQYHFQQFHDVDEAASNLEAFKKKNYFAIVDEQDRFLGIIGLINVIEANRRGNIVLDIPYEEITEELFPVYRAALSLFVDYCQNNLNFHSLVIDAPAHSSLFAILKDSNLTMYGVNPKGFGDLQHQFYDLAMFESCSNQLPWKEKITSDFLSLDLESFPLRPFSPFLLKEGEISLVKGEYFPVDQGGASDISRFLNNMEVAVPLGEAKENWDLEKAVQLLGESDYVVAKEGRPIGFISSYNNSLDSRSCAVEIGILDPEEQGKGYGGRILSAFTKELFSKGVLSISANIFAFNNRSLALFRKEGYQEIACRHESYFAAGKLHDTYTLVKKNPVISTLTRK